MDFSYLVINNTVKITCYYGSDSTVVVPACIGDLPVTAIGESAFAWNRSISSVVLPDSVTVIGEKAFYNCWMLEKIALPEQVRTIGDDAFRFCRRLADAVIPDSVISIGKGAFACCDSLRTALLGNGLTDIGEGAFSCDGALESLTVGDKNPVFQTVDGVLFAKKQMVLVQYPNRRKGTDYAVPDTVRMIGRYAFAWNQGLRSVVMPDCLESIGNGAFQYAEIEEISLGDNLRAIGACAFEQCDKLHNVCFPERLKFIGEAAFCQCRAMTEIRIPDSVISIGAHAFQLCTRVTDVLIGKGIAFIGDRAFSGTNFTTAGNRMNLRSFTVLNRTVPIDIYTFDFNPHLILYGYPDNVTLKARAGSTMRFQPISCGQTQPV